MSFDRKTIIADIVIIAICVAVGAVITWYVTRPPDVVETPAAAVKQPDGSTVIERAAADPKAAAVVQIPKGGQLERKIQFVVQSTPIKLPPIAPGQPAPEPTCPPVTVDLALVRMADQTRRVVAKASGGDIVGGIDVPVDTPALDAPKPWAAGLSYDPFKETPGAWIERDLWRVRVGLEVAQTRQQIGGPAAVETRLRVGFTF